jgi:predicted ferric reductase
MSWKLSSVVALGLVAAVLLSGSSSPDESGSASWDALRAAGFTAYLLTWLSVVAGLALRLRVRIILLSSTRLLEIHRASATLALAFVAGHLAGIFIDPWTTIGPLDAALGFTSPYRPAAVLLGSIALWLMLAVLLSTALAGRIHIATWRALHYLAFPAYLAILLHGVTAGTDRDSAGAIWLFASTSAVIAGLFVVRIFDMRTVRRSPFLSPSGPPAGQPRE